MTVPKDYSDLMIQKPWGFEYLFYQNNDVAIWCLHISEGQETSLHCHPKKKTGLIMISGEAVLSFLNDTTPMKPLDRHILRPGLFHSTRAIGDRAILLEIETPPVKEDIVRFDDKYGRKNKPMEGDDAMVPLASYYPRLDYEGCYINGLFITIEKFPGEAPDSAVIAVLNGGLMRDGDEIVGVGDVGAMSSLRRLALSFEAPQNTELMTICDPLV